MNARPLALLMLALLGPGGPRSQAAHRAPPAPRVSPPVLSAPFPTPYHAAPVWDAEYLPDFEAVQALSFRDPLPTLTPVPLSARQTWAWIVAGESGGGWPEGSALVAWTLRAWEVYRGMPAALAGPRWGWYGWREPGFEARGAVQAVWGQPPLSAPFEFMQAGQFCYALGSARDGDYWRGQGWYGEPDFVITHPAYPSYAMECFFQPPG